MEDWITTTISGLSFGISCLSLGVSRSSASIAKIQKNISANQYKISLFDLRKNIYLDLCKNISLEDLSKRNLDRLNQLLNLEALIQTNLFAFPRNDEWNVGEQLLDVIRNLRIKIYEDKEVQEMITKMQKDKNLDFDDFTYSENSSKELKEYIRKTDLSSELVIRFLKYIQSKLQVSDNPEK